MEELAGKSCIYGHCFNGFSETLNLTQLFPARNIALTLPAPNATRYFTQDISHESIFQHFSGVDRTPGALCALTHWVSPRGQRKDVHLQLAIRAPQRRDDDPAARRHRCGAQYRSLREFDF